MPISKRQTTRRTHKPAAGWKTILRRYQDWELAFFAIGLLSFAGLFVVFFLPIDKGPENFIATAPMPAAGSPAFIDTLSRSMTLPVDHGPHLQILENGDAFRPALLHDIDNAKTSIDFMVYIWKDGRFSDQVLQHLEQCLRRGVQVRIIVDAYGGLKAPRRKFRDLKKLGARIATFHSLWPLPWTFAREAKRDHRRAIVIDGMLGYTGGMAIDDVWLGNARTPDEWHDLMFRVTGPMVARVQGSFAEVWSMLTGELLSGAKFYPPLSDGGPATIVPLSSTPSPDLFPPEIFILFSLLGAQHDIEIETPYFLSDRSMRNILEQKARSGVSVRILVPNNHTDEKSVRWAGQRVYTELLEAGVQIYEFQPTFTHTKLLVEDGQWSIIGSANMDNRSRKLNDEILFGIADQQLNTALLQVFEADIKQSKRIELGEWQRRGVLQKALELVSQAFVQQY